MLSSRFRRTASRNALIFDDVSNIDQRFVRCGRHDGFHHRPTRHLCRPGLRTPGLMITTKLAGDGAHGISPKSGFHHHRSSRMATAVCVALVTYLAYVLFSILATS